MLPNPSFANFSDTFANLGITSFAITVSGAGTGNGTFTESDFTRAVWNTGGFLNAPLDLTTELVGRPTGELPRGTSDRTSGDFNVFSRSGSGAPRGTFYFELTTAEGNGDKLLLTNFTPVFELIRGYCNHDGIVDFWDISQFISFLFIGYLAEADINEDGIVDFLDIGPFIELLSS